MPKNAESRPSGEARLTGDAAFAQHTKDIAARNAKAQDEARKVRDAQREREAARRRRRDG